MRKNIILGLLLVGLWVSRTTAVKAMSCQFEDGTCLPTEWFTETNDPCNTLGSGSLMDQCCAFLTGVTAELPDSPVTVYTDDFCETSYNPTDPGDPTDPDDPVGPGEIGAPSESGGAYYFFDDFWLDSNGTMVRSVYNNTGSLINIIVRNLFIVAGILFFALIVFSGFKLIFMGDKAKALNSVKQYLTTGVIGLLIMFVAYWVVQLIEILTGGNIL